MGRHRLVRPSDLLAAMDRIDRWALNPNQPPSPALVERLITQQRRLCAQFDPIQDEKLAEIRDEQLRKSL